MDRVTYEITANVLEEKCSEYERYMTERHIPDLMSTGAFSAATFSRSAIGRYRIRYEAYSRRSLDDYLSKHSARLRAEMVDAFPDGLEMEREEWQILGVFGEERAEMHP